MKKSIFALAFMIGATFSTAFAHGEPESTLPEAQLEMRSVAELKMMYGVDLFANTQGANLSDDLVLLVNAQPCATGTLNIACEGQYAYIRQQAQIDANACCCIQGWAALCCDNGEVIVIFVEAEPNSPLCN